MRRRSDTTRRVLKTSAWWAVQWEALSSPHKQKDREERLGVLELVWSMRLAKNHLGLHQPVCYRYKGNPSCTESNKINLTAGDTGSSSPKHLFTSTDLHGTFKKNTWTLSNSGIQIYSFHKYLSSAFPTMPDTVQSPGARAVKRRALHPRCLQS